MTRGQRRMGMPAAAARRPWALVLLLVLVLATDSGDARKSKKAKAKARRGSGGSAGGTLADAQSLLRQGQGRAAAENLLVASGVSGGVAGLTSSKPGAVATEDEWELYMLGASLVREHSGSQAAVLAGVEVLKQVVRQAGQAATPAEELSAGTQHKIVGNTSPCKQSKTSPACRPFSTVPLAPLPGEQARVRREVGGWVGEGLRGAALGEPVTVDSDAEAVSVTLLSREPFVATVSGFLSPSESAHLVSATSQAIHSRTPGGDLCVKPERVGSLARARDAAEGTQGGKNARGWSCWPLATGGIGELVTSTSVQMDRGVE